MRRTEWITDPRHWGPANTLHPPQGSTATLPEDPLGPYMEAEFDEEPETAPEAFRQWSHRNKKWVYSVLLGMLVFAFVLAIGREQENSQGDSNTSEATPDQIWLPYGKK